MLGRHGVPVTRMADTEMLIGRGWDGLPGAALWWSLAQRCLEIQRVVLRFSHASFNTWNPLHKR